MTPANMPTLVRAGLWREAPGQFVGAGLHSKMTVWLAVRILWLTAVHDGGVDGGVVAPPGRRITHLSWPPRSDAPNALALLVKRARALKGRNQTPEFRPRGSFEGSAACATNPDAVAVSRPIESAVPRAHRRENRPCTVVEPRSGAHSYWRRPGR